MGDSGYIILRKNGEELKEAYATEDMLHGFNFPYQVGHRGDDPYSASVESLDLEVNDVVVLATDGLWDNVEKEQIIPVISKAMGKSIILEDLVRVAGDLSNLARKNALNK